ncbi:MAG: RNA polymerase-binding protein DksA [Deltaproteobacteria bacterium]|nr:RNA polymerase-binding protein DksA [Deltaproteobacteria bacterium]
MTKTKLEYFRKVLNTQLGELNKEQDSTISQIKHDDEVYADWTDVASVETDKTLQLKIRDRERMLITKIEEALRRIEEGTFGECERCGDEIAEPRLKARPVTTLCIDCKSELEGAEHRYRYA